MDLSRKPVSFHLTAQGRRALGKLMPKRGSFRTLVMSMDSTGAWVLFPGASGSAGGERIPVMLLKWEYISTVVLDFSLERPRARAVPGFVQV